MRFLSFPALQRFAPAAPVVLRVVVGVVMATHGWQKLTVTGPTAFGESMLTDLGVPLPVLFGWIVTLVELVGGVLLVAGLFARVAAGAVTAVLVGATVLVKLDLGLIAPAGGALPGAELDLALIAGALGVLLLGPGKPSLDHVAGIESGIPRLRDDNPALERV